jgi:lipid II isoglutaminyl synthase (glutamine-hydrolysing)
MPKITIGFLYPTVMSHYGDRGNLITLTKRCAWRGIDVDVQHLEVGAAVDGDVVDLFLMGGGADGHQRLVAEDMRDVKGPGIRTAIEAGASALMVCGGYQLWGEFYRTYDGTELKGLGIFPAYTEHHAAQIGATLTNITNAGEVRTVGNLIVEWGEHTLVGFENHGGRTYLREGAKPLGKVLLGGGNNSEDGFEGCVVGNAIGTYLHGSALPKNPVLADFLIQAAVRRREPSFELPPLDDGVEDTARESVRRWVLELAGRSSAVAR